MRGETLQISRTAPQRRHFHRNHIKAEIKILAERPSAILLFKLRLVAAMMRHVRLSGDVFPQPLVFPLLQQPQQFGLYLHRQVADFVQKQSAAIRRLHLAPMVFDRSGERAFDVAKKFAFQNSLERLGQLTVTNGLSAKWLC